MPLFNLISLQSHYLLVMPLTLKSLHTYFAVKQVEGFCVRLALLSSSKLDALSGFSAFG